MINEENAKRFCKDDISKIENYDKAIVDTTQMWCCHHRNELTLDGEYALSEADLKIMNMYFHRPYFELIFLPSKEHRSLHGRSMGVETRKKLSEAQKRRYADPEQHKPLSDEARKKISEALIGNTNHKGKKHTDETKKRIGETWEGRKHSEETKKKMSEVRKGKHWKIENGKRVCY